MTFARSKKVFTLVEVIISVAILSIGLAVILQGLANSLNALRISENNLETSFIFGNKMSELEMEREREGELNGWEREEFASGRIVFDWDVTFLPVEDIEEVNKMVAVLSWKEGRRRGEIKVPTYFRSSLDNNEER